ncbi:MAG: ABC transporter ATP-binding protein/permease [Verrucomicrobia subdivision 3 bacterium]|nr:ABC transporter ATP-binding protein/permease [Limisphaerales bacterium]
MRSRRASLFEVSRWALGYALCRWAALLGVIGAMLVKAGLDVLKPWPMVFLVDHVLQGRVLPAWAARLVEQLPGPATAPYLIGWSVGATVALFLLSWAAGLASTYANISLGQRMVYDLAADLYARLQKLSLRFHARRAVGDNIRRVTGDCAALSIIVKDGLLPVASAAISLVSMFVIMWRVNPLLAFMALAVVPCMILVFRGYAGPMLDRSYRQQELEGRIYSEVEQTFSGLAIVQAFGREDLNDARFRQCTASALHATLDLTNVQLQFKMLMGLTTALGTAAILWFGTQQGLAGTMTVGTILLFLSYLGSLYTPLESVMYISSTIQGAAGSVQRVWEILELESDVKDKPGAVTLESVKGNILIENVTFGYEVNRPVLRGVSLEINPGETVALVGPTGAGKTTLAALLPRFFDPWGGRITLDGRDVRDVQLKSLRGHVALVLQEAFLFPLSISENIAYGQPHASVALIEAAARAAGAHEFVSRLPRGYQTVIGERGATLSGGERQRLAIARALLKDAPILILDEPTSALDAETEAALVETLRKLSAGKTTLIIAHRLSTVRYATRIVVLSEGRIVETGAHEQLLAAQGHYARLYRMQTEGNA